MQDIFDKELNDYLEQPENECIVCATETPDDKEYCSRQCYEADLR